MLRSPIAGSNAQDSSLTGGAGRSGIRSQNGYDFLLNKYYTRTLLIIIIFKR